MLTDDDPGEEVEGKYSADLFVNRATKIFEDQRQLEKTGDDQPWFIYLSFQSVHSPLQVNSVSDPFFQSVKAFFLMFLAFPAIPGFKLFVRLLKPTLGPKNVFSLKLKNFNFKYKYLSSKLHCRFLRTTRRMFAGTRTVLDISTPPWSAPWTTQWRGWSRP